MTMDLCFELFNLIREYIFEIIYTRRNGKGNTFNFPANTLRNNDVVIASKQRHFDVITSKWRRFDVITTLLLRHVFRGLWRNTVPADHGLAPLDAAWCKSIFKAADDDPGNLQPVFLKRLYLLHICIFSFFSCDQAALQMVFSVCPSHLFDYVPIIVSSWNFQKLLPMTNVRSMQKVKVKGQGHRGHIPT